MKMLTKKIIMLYYGTQSILYRKVLIEIKKDNS